MKKRWNTCISIFALAVLVCVPFASAQEKDPRLTQPTKPVPPLPGPESTSKAPTEADAKPSEEPQADKRPLSGVQDLGLGGGGRSMLMPSIQFLQSVDSNRNSVGTTSELQALTTLRGQIALQKIWTNRATTLNYAGGGSIYDSRSQTNGQFHQFGINQTFSLRRWNLMFADQMSYSPDGSFGGGGSFFNGIGNTYAGGLGGGIGTIGGLGVGLNPGVVPSQTIFSARGARISNAVVGQTQYNLSARSSVNVSGNYGNMHFFDPGFIDSKNFGFTTGFNRQVTGRDTVSVSYGINFVRFDASQGAINNHNIQVAYGRRVTGRIALQIAGGPQINKTENPVTGNTTRLSWGTRMSLMYRLQRTDFDLSYNRNITGGSGLLLGAQTDQFHLGANRQLTRNWSGNLGIGYAHNASLRELNLGTVDRSFNSIQADFTVRRPVGRYANMYFVYNIQWQNTLTTPCVTVACETRFIRHHFGFGFDWQFRPIHLD
ncbi:MAG: hypothetical protein HY046_05550 [Acidobacteria bacterium]|nr:hypothetical protein [Acidobacteriota bacterium]